MEITLTKGYLALHRATSTDKYRENLHGILVDGTHAVATNGQILVAVSLPDSASAEADRKPVVIPASAAREAEKRCRNGETATVSETAVQTGDTRIAYQSGDLDYFPDWKSVMPKTGRPSITVRLDSCLLRRLLDTVERLETPSERNKVPVDIEIPVDPKTGEVTKEALCITRPDVDGAVALIMPMQRS